MLDSPVFCWNISSFFPYSQLFLQSRPSRFHNSVEIIIASQGSERGLQVMDKILSPLSGDAPMSKTQQGCPEPPAGQPAGQPAVSFWSLQSCSDLGDWSYLSMGSKHKSQYQLIGGKIHQKSLDHHPEEANHYFCTPIGVISLQSCGIPCPTPNTCWLWFQVIYGAKAVADTAQHCSPLDPVSWTLADPLGIWQRVVSFFVAGSREGKHLNRKIWSSLACSKDCNSCICDGVFCWEGSLSLPQAGALFSLVSLLCSNWRGARRLSSPPHGPCHIFCVLEHYFSAQFACNPEKHQTGGNNSKINLERC